MQTHNDLSPSWKRMEKLPNEQSMGDFDSYFMRVHHLIPNVPEVVLKQWIHPHQGEYVTRRNYAWLDYDNLLYTLEQWSTQDLLDLYVVEEYRDYVLMRAECKDYSDFHCTETDLNFWKSNATWRTPPVVLDVISLDELPQNKELVSPHQLIEGHSRLGYLKAMANMAKIEKSVLAISHLVWVLRQPITGTRQTV